jgi:hypothetical protein
MPSAGLSRPFGCCPRFQNDDICDGIWVSVRRESHTDSDQASMGASETLENLFFLFKSSQWAVWQGTESWRSNEISACLIPWWKCWRWLGDSNSTHYRSFWLSNVDSYSRQQILWTYILMFLTCNFFQNGVRLPQYHGKRKCFMSHKILCPRYSMLSKTHLNFSEVSVAYALSFTQHFTRKFARNSLSAFSEIITNKHTYTNGCQSDMFSLTSWILHWIPSRNASVFWCCRRG